MGGQKLNGSVIKVSPSKTPIVPINRDFMPRDEKELERCERTVYVNQIDRAVPGSAVEAMFESFCGTCPAGSVADCTRDLTLVNLTHVLNLAIITNCLHRDWPS